MVATRSTRTRRVSYAVMTMMVGAMLAACTPQESAEEVNVGPDDAFAFALEEAREGGDAGEEQIALLEEAAEQGELSFDDYQAAIQRTLACMNDAGVLTQGPTTDRSQGYPRLNYSYAGGINDAGEPSSPIPDACIQEHSRYVELAYSEQPSSREAQDELLESKRSEILACAEDRNLAVEADLPMRDLLVELLQYGDEAMECYREAGITSF